jgi:PAS domain S-box-containing protein
LSTPIERVELLAAERLSQPDPLLQEAFEAAGDGIAVVQIDGPRLLIARANRRLAEVLEVEPDALRGGSLTDYTDEAGALTLADLVAFLTRGQATRYAELAFRPGTTRQRWMRVTLTPLQGTRPGGLAVATFTDISDRRSIDAVTATLPVELIGLDRELRIRWANLAAARAANMTVEEMLGRDWLQFMPSAAARRDIYDQVLAGASFDFEAVPFSRKSGCVRWYQTALRPLRDGTGSITGLLAMARDVTDSVSAQQAIERAEHRFAAMIQGSNDVITIIDAGGRITFESPSIARISGYRPDDLVGRLLFEFVHPDDVEPLRERLACAVEEGHRVSIQPVTMRFRHRDGHYIWLEATASNLLDDPAIRGIVAVSRDISLRRATEAAMEDSRAKLELALTGAAVGTWDYDVITGVHRFDARCAGILGLDVPEIVADLTQLAAMTHPDDIVAAREALVKHLRGDIDWYETEYRARDASGEWRWVAARGRAATRDAQGRVLRLAGVLMDIDARKRAEHVVQIQTALLETAAADGQLGLWSWYPRTNTGTSNDSWCEMTGYGADEWQTEDGPWPRRVHPDDRAAVLAGAQSLVDGTQQSLTEDIEYRFLTKRGDWRWFAARARVVERDAAGATTRIVGRTLDVTAQKRVRQFLQETQAAAGVGGWELDLRTGALAWTDETYALFDTTRDAFQPTMEATFPLYDSAYHELMQAAVDAAVARGEPFDIAVECQTLQGRRIWLRLICKAEMVEGRAVRLYGAKQDITELRRVDAALKKSEAELRALASNAPDWLALLDLDLRIRFVNRGLRKLEPAEAVGVHSLSIVPEELRPALGGAADQAIAHARPVMVEVNLPRSSGAEAIFEFHAAPVIDAGQVVGLSVRITDITETRRREATLRMQARMLETLREGVLLIDADGRIQIANAAASRMFGATAAALVGTDVDRLGLDPRRLDRYLRDGARLNGETLEWRARRLDGGKEFVAEAAVVELRESATTIPLSIAVIMDVTERRMLERAIIDATHREQQRIGHDLHDGLGQELTGISLMLRSFAQRAAREYPTGAPILNELVHLVNQAVESARALAHGLSPVILERGGLPAALEQLAASASRTHGLRVRFGTAIQGALDIDSTATHHLYRIAQEAVTNAARHSGATMVSVRLTAGQHRISLTITDNGCGLPPPAAGTGSGDGMGLRIMEYRARMMHAQFGIRRLHRGGTRVRVTLPRCPLARSLG